MHHETSRAKSASTLHMTRLGRDHAPALGRDTSPHERTTSRCPRQFSYRARVDPSGYSSQVTAAILGQLARRERPDKRGLRDMLLSQEPREMQHLIHTT